MEKKDKNEKNVKPQTQRPEGLDRASLEFLSEQEYKTVQRNMEEIVESRNPLYIGQRVSELHALLASSGYFLKAINAVQLVVRTAYGYMYGYRNATAQLPSGAVAAMMNRKLVVNANRNRGSLGEWTAAIEATPPPATGTPETYARWVENMIASNPKRLNRWQARNATKDPDEALLECYRFIESVGRRLPPRPATRQKFARRLIGATMKYFDLKPEKFTPIDAPAPPTR